MKMFFDMISRMTAPQYFAEDGAGGTADTPPAAATPDASAVADPNADAGTGQPPANPAPQDVVDWSKDERYGRMWNKGNKVQFTPEQHKVINEGMYKSYRNGEKMWEPTKKELDALKKDKEGMSALAKEYGISLDKLKDVLEEHKSFKDPKNPVVSRGSYLSEWYDDPERAPLYGDKITSFFTDLERQEMQRLYPGMNEKQITEMMELKQKVQAVEQREKEEAKKKATELHGKVIDQGMSDFRTYAKEKGVEYKTEEWSKIQSELMDYCIKNKVQADNVYFAARKLFDAAIDKVWTEKIKSGQLQNLNKNKGATVLKSGTQASTQKQGGTLAEKLAAAADKQE